MNRKKKRKKQPQKSKKPDRQGEERSEADKQRSHEKFLHILHSTSQAFEKLIIAGAIILTCYVTFYLPATIAPGEKTIVTITQNFLAKINANVYVAWSVALGATLLYQRERIQKIRERDHKDKRIRTLEQKIDPSVTSSGMSLDGSKSLEDVDE